MRFGSFMDAANYVVRYIVRQAYNMPANSVRPDGQPAPTGVEGDEFATVKILDADSDWGTWSTEYSDDPTTGSTRVIENTDNVYRFTASIQFFRHRLGSTPALNATSDLDAAGLSKFGMGAFDKASRLGARLSTSRMTELMVDTCGIGMETVSKARNLSQLISGAYWDDRGSVDVTFVAVNRETDLLETFSSAAVTIEAQSQGGDSATTINVEVTT